MHEDCYFCVKRDICTRDVPKPCRYSYTEDQRKADQASDIYGAILAGMYLPKTYLKKKEETKMNATSVQVINNVKDMRVTIERGPLEETRIIISVSTDDDTYEINCSGLGCEKFLRKHDFVHAKEYEYVHNQLMEREKEIRELKQKLQQVERDKKRLTGRYEGLDSCYNGLLKDYHQLKDKLDLERAANEAQHKFIRKYAGKGTEIEFNYAIGDTDEVSYVISDKKEYEEKIKELENENKNILDTKRKLQEKIFHLEGLKTPTIENFADEEPSSRRDILRCAEKCVCGHREQDYGSPESNFQLIADLWNDYLKKERSSIVVDAKDVAMLMALMKIARIKNGGGSGDSFVDLAGYAACGGEIWHSNKETNGDSSQETN